MAPSLRLGTRASLLATTQSRGVAQEISANYSGAVNLVPVTTHGDVSTAPLSQMGGTGVFIAALRQALHAGEVDLVVHSHKDLPTTPEPGLIVAAVPKRESPLDALVSRDGMTLAELPPGARVGTGSPRRAAQLLASRPDLTIVDIRGNVDTRLARVAAHDLDAVVLARAGLNRIDRSARITQILEPSLMVPAPGQGALAVECREDDEAVRDLLASLDHPETHACVIAERAMLATVEAGCAAPVGALAQVDEISGDKVLTLLGSVTSLDGRQVLREQQTGALTAPHELGYLVAHRLLERGAGDLVRAAQNASRSTNLLESASQAMAPVCPTPSFTAGLVTDLERDS